MDSGRYLRPFLARDMFCPGLFPYTAYPACFQNFAHPFGVARFDKRSAKSVCPETDLFRVSGCTDYQYCLRVHFHFDVDTPHQGGEPNSMLRCRTQMCWINGVITPLGIEVIKRETIIQIAINCIRTFIVLLFRVTSPSK